MTDSLLPRLIRWYSKLPPDAAPRNLVITSLVALVAASLVSTAALILQPIYQSQRLQIRQASIDQLIASIPSLKSLPLEGAADSLETHLVILDTGCYENTIDVASFDARAAEIDDEQSREMTPVDNEPVALKRRSNLERVHLLYDDDQLRFAILPVHGSGYQSTLYAWLVLSSDLNTIVALDVYEHAETPGIGSRVDDPAWQDQWTGKQLFDEQNALAIRVTGNAGEAAHQVHGITGATRTSEGVENLVRFWAGNQGYGPFLKKLREDKRC